MGVNGLISLLNAVDFPVIISNLNISRDDPIFQTHALKESVVLDIEVFKVGIVGYLTPDTNKSGKPIDLEFKPEVDGFK